MIDYKSKPKDTENCLMTRITGYKSASDGAMRKILRLSFLLLITGALGACVSSPPQNPNKLCDVFDEKDDWYDDARSAQKKWGSPISVMMAIMRQESSFKEDAAPPRSKILWFIPGPRKSSAYGYAQAKDGTWDWYKKSIGSWGADRDDFDDAIDFVGWYNHQSYKTNGIKKTDAYRLYLAYHEGHGGYKRQSYNKKPWLKKVARKVSQQAARYKKQLQSCEKRLQSGGWFFF